LISFVEEGKEGKEPITVSIKEIFIFFAGGGVIIFSNETFLIS